MATTLLAPAQLRMAKLALSMHLTSPTVFMFNEIATQNGAKTVQCENFVTIASKQICDNDALSDILKSSGHYVAVSYFICKLAFRPILSEIFENGILQFIMKEFCGKHSLCHSLTLQHLCAIKSHKSIAPFWICK